MVLSVKSALGFLQLAAVAAVVALASPARAATDIMWWHAMSGELGRQLEKLAADFNASQSEYRVVPSYKGNYTDTVTAAIFAFRSRSQPAIVQVNEIATATMMAAKGAIYPVFELMRDEKEVFSPAAYLPAVTGYYADAAGNMLSFPFNASTPILYYNKNLFRAAGLDPEIAPKTWAEVGAAAKRLRATGAVCGFTTSWPSWINVENFSAFHNLPISTRANGFDGLDAVLAFNNPVMVRHIAQLAEWQAAKVFDYSGRATTAEPRFQNGECGIFIGSSATRADIKANSKFEVGYGMLPYWPDVEGAPQNTIIGGATLWVLRDRPRAEYKESRHRDFDRADHAEAADGKFERCPARILRSDSRCDRRRTGAGFRRQEIRAGRAGFRRRARRPAAASVRAGESGPVATGLRPMEDLYVAPCPSTCLKAIADHAFTAERIEL